MKIIAPKLSGYRILWVMALFDLPVLTKPERKRATKFRAFLLDEGFTMMQFSCYLRFTSGKEHAETLTRRIGANVPNPGKVEVIWFTDKHPQLSRSHVSAPPGQARTTDAFLKKRMEINTRYAAPRMDFGYSNTKKPLEINEISTGGSSRERGVVQSQRLGCPG